ncbi:glycosyltransferase family 2 protein [Hanstruepera ponticola]|uniref:glycosyltransferase family 2 protein n=1 Tax=Hanstruepera ponticola TaxID=2042995 RepID=UPI000CF016A6|nr:glycosyltransferase family 2 protein [Hanstruepera ponticola]
MPKVSIIIPNFNHQPFLKQRIDSVFNQTFQDFELILLDDASSDDSQDVLKLYLSHPKVSCLLINEVNSGSVFKQWIKGIELSKGKYIWIAESDDYADSKFLETTLSPFSYNDSLGMVFTDTEKVDYQGNSLGLVSKSKSILADLSNNNDLINKSNLSSYLLKQMVIVNASSVLFKKEALLQLDFNSLKKFKNTGDVFVYLGVALNYDIFFLPQPLNFMRLHERNTTKKYKRNGQIYKDKLLMLDYYLKDFHDKNINKADLLYFFKSNMLFFADYMMVKTIKATVNKMVDFNFISKTEQLKILTVIFIYKIVTFNGRPHTIRKFFKFLIKNT